MSRNFFLPTIFFTLLLITLSTGNKNQPQIDSGNGGETLQRSLHKSFVTIDTLKSINAPGGGDSRGLTWDGKHLWFSEDDSNLLFKIDTSNGTVLDSFPLPGQSYTEGLAWDGKYIWHPEYDGNVYKIDPTDGTILDTINAPTDKPTGLTWDGTYLWTANYSVDSIYQFSPQDGKLKKRFAAPGPNAWGLTMAKNLWNCNYKSQILEIDTSNGTVLSSYDSPANTHFLGMTFDGSHLWVVDNEDDKIKKLNIDVLTSIDRQNHSPNPTDFSLEQNYPNPFNPTTAIRYQLSAVSQVDLSIYNVMGQKVANLVSEYQSAGNHKLTWNAEGFPSGLYFYRLKTDSNSEIRKMMLLK